MFLYFHIFLYFRDFIFEFWLWPTLRTILCASFGRSQKKKSFHVAWARIFLLKLWFFDPNRDFKCYLFSFFVIQKLAFLIPTLTWKNSQLRILWLFPKKKIPTSSRERTLKKLLSYFIIQIEISNTSFLLFS